MITSTTTSRQEKTSDAFRTEVGDLVWAVLDDVATESQVRRLDKLLRTSEEARRVYMECVQLDCHLSVMFFERRQATAPPRTARIAA